eukprot:6194076-Pleurochrysis_carterae.AAC.1
MASGPFRATLKCARKDLECSPRMHAGTDDACILKRPSRPHGARVATRTFQNAVCLCVGVPHARDHSPLCCLRYGSGEAQAAVSSCTQPRPPKRNLLCKQNHQYMYD